MFELSVCMIVKNEEEVLERILNCAIKFADEIIIVDTGSTDKTIEIAKKFTNKIYPFTWCEDFSKARNFSFEKATKEYIMWLDADDYINENNINKINHLKLNSNKDIDVYMLKYVMGFVDNYATLEFYRERIIKNNSNYKWSGFIHEVITPSGNIKYLDIEIEHRKEKQGNPKRNLNIYNKALKKGIIFTPRDKYYYARELYYNNYLHKSEKAFKDYLKSNDTYTPNILGAYLMLSNIYLIKNNSSKGKKIIFKYLEDYIPSSELLINLAKFYELEGKFENAILAYQSCIACPKSKNGFTNPDTYEFIPFLELSRLYYKLGKYDYAKVYHIKAKEIHPNHPSIIFNNQFFT